VIRTFVAAIDADLDDSALLAALSARTPAPAQLLRDGALRVAHTGPRPATPCLLDGAVDNLTAVAAAAGVDPALAPEALLAAAHARLGDELPGLLRGAFALLLWRPGAEQVLLLRDHVGDRGLVWTRTGGGVLAAGETADLLAALATARGPDEIALAHWLAVGGMPEDRTLHAGVQRVRPGHLAQVGPAGAVLARRWWQPLAPDHPSPRISLAAAVSGVRTTLQQAVARAIDDAGDDRCAVLLSGGLDSSAVAALASARVRRSYSAVFSGFTSADEAALIDQTTAALGLESVRVDVRGGGILAAAVEYVERWRLPPVSPNLFFWLPLLRRAAADGVELLLDGQGGDEVFGLSPFLLADRLRHGDPIGAVALMGRIPGANHRPPARVVASALGQFGLHGALPPGLAARRRALRPAGSGAPEWLAPRLARAAVEVAPAEDWKRRGGPRWWAHVLAATADGAGPNLAYDHIRRRDALAGVRSRHPLADPDVLEHVLSLPPELAFHPRHSRPLLRDAVAGQLPEAVRLRASKSGFDAPFHAALAGPDREIVRTLLGARDARTRAYTRPAVVARTLLSDVPQDGGARQAWALQTWRLITAELWLRGAEGDLAPSQEFARSDVEVS
jgi:asparagine synthase (glutamine-hydrolysing)